MSLVGFLKSVQNDIVMSNKLNPAVSAAVVLFGKVLIADDTSISQLFERAVALTVVCYSLAGGSVLRGSLFGCPRYYGKRLPSLISPLTVRIAESIEDMLPVGGLQTNEVVVAFENSPGFDSVVTMSDPKKISAYTVYLEQKVAKVENAAAMRVSKIVNSLKFHYLSTRALSKEDQLFSFGRVHVLFHEWIDDSAVVSISRTDVLKAMHEYHLMLLNKVRGKSWNIFDDMLSELVQNEVAEMRRMQACFDTYLSADVDGNSESESESDSVHAHVIGKEVIQEWLVPPVGPIPLLVETILNGDDETPSE
jgi:hypothetical protein